MGRPTELNDITAQAIINAVKSGQTRQCSAEAAGVHRSTLQLWLQKGLAGDPKYSDFSDRLQRAESEFEKKTVELAYTLAEKDYKYLMDFLSRRFPQSWGTLARQPEALAAVPNPLAEMSDEKLMELAREVVPDFAKKVGT